MVLELVLESSREPQSSTLLGCGERNYMARFILTNLTASILKKILIIAGCVLAFAWAQTAALAQRPVVHTGGGGHPGGGARMGAPLSAPRPRVFVPPGVGPRGVGPRGAGPRLADVGHLGTRGGFGPRGFGFQQGPIHFFRSRVFFGAPFFRPELRLQFGVGLKINSLWWPTCGPSLGWAWGAGFECYPFPFYGYNYGPYGFGTNLIPQMYESPVYVYGGGRDLIWLYLKDGTAYSVTDYWLVNGQMHFSMIEDDPTKPAEHAIPYDDLDVQKTIYVNTHRGFRIVFRDEPWQQYLKDHPDATPPDVPPPQKN
jgi:hypothetical protein